jgi:hypothetical protein
VIPATIGNPLGFITSLNDYDTRVSQPDGSVTEVYDDHERVGVTVRTQSSRPVSKCWAGTG